MKDFEKVLIGLIFILVMTAVVLMVLPEKAKNNQDGEEGNSSVRDLFMKGSANGLGVRDYYYHYTESSNGHTREYELHKVQNQSMVSIKSPTSQRVLYFLENDTILCVEFNDREECSSVKNDESLENYMGQIQSMLLDDSKIEKTMDDAEYFERYGYLEYGSNLTPEYYDGKKCLEFSYRFDFRNMSVYEAARFNIGPNTPERFNYTMCVENSTGNILHKEAEYLSDGKINRNMFDLIEADWDTGKELVIPRDLDDDAIWLLAESNRHDISTCYRKEEEEKNRCIAVAALTLKDAKLCDLAGERKDRCLVSLVPLTKDGTICEEINDPEFKDDCYIEMGGATGEEQYCAMIDDWEKKEFCMNVTSEYIPPPVVANKSADSSANSTDGDEDVDQFLKDLYERSKDNSSSENVTE